ncbi:hypothetical protein TrCOL_g3393 [Triparma columacea]|uniref:Arsenite methyltransferase n=1 Tax=Triparma columacea TaxID=722753 RepID=A0A9W7FVP8_9STRA|nr:hypothetical protein TrCOL_g3393 [Triparma columacea]
MSALANASKPLIISTSEALDARPSSNYPLWVYGLSASSVSSSVISVLSELTACNTVVFSLQDFDEDVEDKAMELGLMKVGNVVVRTSSGLLLRTFDSAVAADIQEVVDKGEKGLIRDGYSDTVNNVEGGGCCVSVDSSMNAYTREQLVAAGKEADLGLGCGNPITLASLQPGEVVVDLGSGAGVDCFIAAECVIGGGGKVIGVDMTPAMLEKARKLARERGYQGEELEFRLGEIENLPVADNTAHVVVSNCVVNLSSDKDRVFREWAPEVETLRKAIEGAGFVEVKIEEKEESREVIKQWIPGSGAENFVVSANVSGRKPV